MKYRVTTTETITHTFEIEIPEDGSLDIGNVDPLEWAEDYFVNEGPKPEWFTAVLDRSHHVDLITHAAGKTRKD